MDPSEETVVLEHPHTHLGQQQHQLVKMVPMQAAVAVERHNFNIQQQQVLAEEDLVVGD
jgi:hypothetical protein